MSRNRFELLRSTIHFLRDCDYVGEPRPGSPLYDRTLKVKAVVDAIMGTSATYFEAGDAISIDESMVPARSKYRRCLCVEL